MDKLQLSGWNLGRVFNSRSGYVCAMQLRCFETKRPNLMFITRPRQLLGSLPLDIAFPDLNFCSKSRPLMNKKVGLNHHIKVWLNSHPYFLRFLFTPKVGAKLDLLFNKPASEFMRKVPKTLIFFYKRWRLSRKKDGEGLVPGMGRCKR